MTNWSTMVTFTKAYNILELPKICINKLCPCFWKVCFGREDENKVSRTICSFLYGLLLGLLFYELILMDLDIPPLYTVIIGTVIAGMISVGIAVSRQIRCIALLSFPTLGGRAGRSMLRVSISSIDSLRNGYSVKH